MQHALTGQLQMLQTITLFVASCACLHAAVQIMITVPCSFAASSCGIAMQAELARKGSQLSPKNGVCLEYLRGTCSKGDKCPFSHALQDYYIHVCKRKPQACVAQHSASETLLAALVAGQANAAHCAAPGRMDSSTADHCKRAYVLRCLIPTLIPGDPTRSDAIIAALVRQLSIVLLGTIRCSRRLSMFSAAMSSMQCIANHSCTQHSTEQSCSFGL